ncbi:hypothetical protein HanIR_Chr12g0579311 [Helianthus annuus]|nr:hypothetical protein HanIR_Chr12g0579311 [Helianthus annuus]
MLPVMYTDCNDVVDEEEKSRRSKSRFTSKPSWLLLSISGANLFLSSYFVLLV